MFSEKNICIITNTSNLPTYWFAITPTEDPLFFCCSL